MRGTRQEAAKLGFGAYVRAHALTLVTFAVLEATLALIMRVTRMDDDLGALVCVLVALAVLVALVAEYVRRRSFYRSLAVLGREASNARLLPSLIDEPTFAEGRVAHEALVAVARSANDEVARYRRQVEEYRTYVETWVHEAKTPLAAAHLAVENLRAEAGADPETLPRLRSIDDDLSRVEGYVEQALYYARSETVERDFLVRRHELRGMVSQALRAQASPLIAAHVMPRLGEGLELAVFTDDKWLVFILGQLLQNSARYARTDAQGGPCMWFDARLVAEGTAEEAVELTVRDNGCGVSEADLPRVFERGFTGENGRTHARSTGLGLWLVARLAGKLGIGVRASSTQGEGFCVELSFPTNKMHYFE